MNIREVARLAKVSTATVSRTINGSDKVTPETKERVQRAIEELKFYPNTWARALGSGRSSLYGLIISDITNPFFPELVKSFEDIAVQYGQEVLVANTNYDPERMELCVSRMLQRKVDGVAIMTSEMDERWIREFHSREIPLVFLDTGTAHELTSNIAVDYAAGVDAAVEHIVGLGHTKIAFISGPMMLRSARVRREAFVGCLKRRGIGAGLMEEGNHQVSGGHEAMARLLSGKTRPTAVRGFEIPAADKSNDIVEKKDAVDRGKSLALHCDPFHQKIRHDFQQPMHPLRLGLQRFHKFRRAHQERGDVERTAGNCETELVAGPFNLWLQVLQPLYNKRKQAMFPRIGLFQAVYVGG